MALPNLMLSPSQADDWVIISNIDSSKLEKALEAVSNLDRAFVVASQLRDFTEKYVVDQASSTALVRELLSVKSLQKGLTESSLDVLSAIFQALDRASDNAEAVGRLQANIELLSKLLETESVTLCAKALHLSFEQDRLLVATNIITDIRPIFNNGRDDIFGGVILQSLRLEYLENGERRAITVAVDNDDIEKLIERLQLAKQKATSARNMFTNKLGIPAFLVGEETYGF